VETASGVQRKIRIQFHLPPAMSLLRMWRKPGDRDGGDDLSAFRPSVVWVNKTHKPLAGIEVGQGGCFIRGIVSIDDEENHLGSVECAFPLIRVANILKGIHDEALSIYILKNRLKPVRNMAITAENSLEPFVRIYPVVPTWLDLLCETCTEKMIVGGIHHAMIRFVDFKGFYSFPIKDIMGKNFGMVVYGQDYTGKLQSFRRMVFGIIALFAVAFGILLLILIFIERTITRPITSITSLLDQLSSGLEDLSFRLEGASKDEIGQMSRSFNRFMERMEHLRKFKTIIEEDDSLTEVYQRIATLLKETFGLTSFTIYEINNSKNHIIPVVIEGDPPGGLWCDKNILTDANLCRAKRTSKEVSSVQTRHICPRFIAEEKEDYLCLPVIVGEATGMVLQIVLPKEDQGRWFSSDLMGLLRIYLKECSPVIASKRLVGLLKETTTIDALTGLLNRRFLGDSSETLVSGILRRDSHMGVLMADIDFFKQVNDTYGHETGDEVLKRVARTLRDSIRRSDILVRFGGEEFLILLMDVKDRTAVKAVAEKIRKAVESTSFMVPGGVLKKTISIGAALFPDDTENFWQCIKYADVALYKAKEAGRNRVILFRKDMWEEGSY
jgi:diguanylate cyclase (GGDEF)-like protein